MVSTGIDRIDALLRDPAEPALERGDPDADAVGAIQDLLIGHGAKLPGVLGVDHGVFGPKTERAVRTFQVEHGLPATGKVDRDTLKALAGHPAQSPVAARPYLTLALGIPWSGFARLVSFTAQFEAAGKFTARNRNTDRAGLSFGIIQRAQKHGRLNELLRAFERAQPDRFIAVLGVRCSRTPRSWPTDAGDSGSSASRRAASNRAVGRDSIFGPRVSNETAIDARGQIDARGLAS